MKTEELENKIRDAGISLMPIKQIADIRLGNKTANAWDNIKNIGGKISNSWKSKEQSWKTISDSRN
jgi:hypothetical protein